MYNSQLTPVTTPTLLVFDSVCCEVVFLSCGQLIDRRVSVFVE